MLQKLKIKNIALIENLEVNFDNGLNVITGETGSGKSIIIDSINFLLGARADKSLIRYGEDKAKVEGVFAVDSCSPNIKECFEMLDLEPEDTIIISRTMSQQEKSEIKVNGETVSLNMLKKISYNLIDIYGQNQQLSIIKPAYQLELLDNFDNGLAEIIVEYKKLKKELSDINYKIEQLGGSDEQRAREIELLKYQIDEITNAKISVEEEIDLIETKRKMQNLEKISQNSSNASNLLDNSASSLFQANNFLKHCLDYDKDLQYTMERVESICIELNDINEMMKEYVYSLNFSSNDVDEIEDRISLYNNLKRKYGNNVEDILKYFEDIKVRVNNLENCDYELSKLNKLKFDVLKQIFEVSHKITNIRKECAKKLEKLIMENLAKLGMLNAKLEFRFNDYNEDEKYLCSNGCDSVEIMFCSNKGEELKPLKDVASGGEMSRLILAIKSITADKEQDIAMIFDEIDTGISGNIAQAVAEQIVRISKNHQVFVITHTIQIASIGDKNYLVEKHEENGRTISNIKMLSGEDRVKEIARFLSTGSVNETSIKNAKEIINSQEKLKLEIRK